MSDDSDLDDGPLSSTRVGGGGENSQIEVYGRIRPSKKNDKSVCILNPSKNAAIEMESASRSRRCVKATNGR